MGRIIEIWRFPISSIGGERIANAELCLGGIAGDRQYGLIDAVTGAPAMPEKEIRWRKALYLEAKLIDCSWPIITFPDGQTRSLDEPSLNATLSDYFGFPT